MESIKITLLKGNSIVPRLLMCSWNGINVKQNMTNRKTVAQTTPCDSALQQNYTRKSCYRESTAQ